MTMRGRVWKYGDDINTDVLYPGRRLEVLEPERMARYALEDLDSAFAADVRPGDVVVGGENFGCGSSREQAVSVLVYAGVGAVIAGSFSRIFYRNAISLGLPIVISPEAVEFVDHGQEVEVDLEQGRVRNLDTGREVTIRPLPEHLMNIVTAGGLIPYLKAELKRP